MRLPSHFPLISHLSGVMEAMGICECLPLLTESGQTCFKPTSFIHDRIPTINYFHSMATNHGIGGEASKSNQPIQLMNKFDSLLWKVLYEPCEVSDTYEEDLISSDKEESPELSLPPPPNNPSKNLSPKANLEGLKTKS